jgi:phage terminase large subunit-like protein
MSVVTGNEDVDRDRLREIEEQIAKWDPRARAEAMRQLSAADEATVQAWYCDRGRKCDGKPHGEYLWNHARGDQWPPRGQDWFVWACLAGRGWGKTRTGAEYTRKMSEKVGRMALIAPTATDARDTMVEGVSGIIAVCERAGMKAHYEPAKRRITFPSGSRATLFSAEEPNRLRGPQHGFAWLDEPAHMPLIEDVWSNLLFGLRLPPRPHIIVTTTPTPKPWVRKLVADPTTVPVRGKTHDNLDNLADQYREVIKAWEGTRLGRQELYGEILEDVEGALWNSDIIGYDEAHGVADMDRIVVAIDPAGTANRRSDETGIVAAGIRRKAAEAFGQQVDVGYVLADRSGTYSPQQWAQAAMKLYDELGADAIVVETNFGADMVEDNLRHYGFAGHLIKARAMRGKELRAEPIVGLYEQHRVKHVAAGYDPDGPLGKLEDEMLNWVPGEGASPNRVDALVWALTELLKPGGEITFVTPRSLGRPATGNPFLDARPLQPYPPAPNGWMPT